MPTMAPERPETAIAPGYPGFLAFVDSIGESLAPYQRRIARAFFDNEETVVILPKGNLKTTTAALLGLHHLLVTADAEVRIVAASRRHAEICLKRMKGFARHPLVRDRVTITYFELRHEELRGDLTVLSSDGAKLHGDSPTLILCDEVWAWKSQAEMLEAVREAAMKRPGCRTLFISTASARLDGPLGRMRTEAMASPSVKRRGPVLEAKGGDLHWLEWSVAEDADLDDVRAWQAQRRQRRDPLHERLDVAGRKGDQRGQLRQSCRRPRSRWAAGVGTFSRDTARAMSRENVELAARFYEATGSKAEFLSAMPRLMEFCHPEVDWTPREEGRTYRGREAVREALEGWLESFDDYSFEVQRIIECGGDHVLVVGLEVGKGAMSGAQVRSINHELLTIREGMIVRFREFYDEAEALEAAGLRE
jgi:ketosteroid isomerase-like protein